MRGGVVWEVFFKPTPRTAFEESITSLREYLKVMEKVTFTVTILVTAHRLLGLYTLQTTRTYPPHP